MRYYSSATAKAFGSDDSLWFRAGLTAGIKPAAREPSAHFANAANLKTSRHWCGSRVN